MTAMILLDIDERERFREPRMFSEFDRIVMIQEVWHSLQTVVVKLVVAGKGDETSPAR